MGTRWEGLIRGLWIFYFLLPWFCLFVCESRPGCENKSETKGRSPFVLSSAAVANVVASLGHGGLEREPVRSGVCEHMFV